MNNKISYEASEEDIIKMINLRKQRKLLDIENRKKISKFITPTKDGVKHFSVPLTDKYEAYTCFALPENPTCCYIAALVVKVKNKQKNSDSFLFRIFIFDRENLDENLFLKDKFQLDLINKLLEEHLLYLTSEKFTDSRIELGLEKIYKQ